MIPPGAPFPITVSAVVTMVPAATPAAPGT